MDIDLARDAISCALSGNWERACTINKKILTENPKDVDALNRLSRAHMEVGDIKKAREFAQKVLKIDPFNTIATKALEKWKNIQKYTPPKTNGESLSGSSTNLQLATFLEEPGKTKIVSLLHLGGGVVLGKIDAGDKVKLNLNSHRIGVTTLDGKYIGKLPDDLSARLKKLLKHGNEYQVFVKSADKDEVKIFIRETKRAPKLAEIPSFSTEMIEYISFAPPELVHKKVKGESVDNFDETEEE